MAGYYESDARGFQLFSSRGQPSWREPQLAALGAVLAQWSLAGSEAPLVAVPTGVGKTAIALAAPFLAKARRTLVVVPTQELRRQTVEAFRSQAVLLRIGALAEAGFASPVVQEAAGRTTDWSQYESADVVVGIPASVSPAATPEALPPDDLFDLVIVDEAHHAPAATWLAILDHFKCRQLLLTATPHRRDRKRLPGKLSYYYPLRQALDEKLYQPVDPVLLPVEATATRADMDAAIASTVLEVLQRPEHQTSQVLVRAGSRARAHYLADLYLGLGQALPVLHSGLGQARQRGLIDGLRAGTHRGLVMVGMLVEGFDLASLRVAGYHDKHKSLEPTAQLIGRLARVNEDHPQRSVLVTARDIDVYPHLEGAVRELYEQDRDWATVLPGIIDAHVEDDLRNSEYARSFGSGGGIIDPAHLQPLRRTILLEVVSPTPWSPTFAEDDLPPELSIGEVFAGKPILFSGTNPERTTLVIVTGASVGPRWSSSKELDSMEYDLHVVSHRVASRVDQPDLLLLNTARNGARRALVELVGAKDVTRQGDAGRLQRAFDSLERLSVSSVGVRNTYGPTRGTPSYKMFAGSSIESGLRDSDTAQASLGHAMVQVASSGGAFTAGVSTGKGKYWETRYTPLRLYEAFVAEFTDRYWFPTVSASGPLLPHINRGATLVTWPASPVLAVAMDHALIGKEWTLDPHGSLDFVDLLGGDDAVAAGATASTAPEQIPLAAVVPSPTATTTIWTGYVDVMGEVVSTSADLPVRRGHSNPTAFSDLLMERPPTLFFLDGTTTRGRELFPPSTVTGTIPVGLVVAETWAGVDITAETKAKATSNAKGISVHEWLERHLIARPRRGRHRWIVSNDGSGEIADYIVIETMANGQIAVDLWHAKFAGGAAASVRVGDFEVVTAQAIKSRRWPTDRDLWSHLGARLHGHESPRAHLIEGRTLGLDILLGRVPRWERLSAARRKPSIVGTIGIVQPGLGSSQLDIDLRAGTTSAVQIVQLLTVFKDAVLSVAEPIVIAAP